MDKRLLIRKTGIKVADILEQISRGKSCREILSKYPQLNKHDIFKIIRKTKRYIDKFEDDKTVKQIKYDWKKDELSELKNLYQNGASIVELARIMNCSVNSVINQLMSMKLINQKKL